eukprot:9355083-Alexandrium_andersonii.AAC.1
MITTRPEFNATNPHFGPLASFMLTSQPSQGGQRQGDKEDLCAVGGEINLSAFSKGVPTAAPTCSTAST